jgi:hypothetical protein
MGLLPCAYIFTLSSENSATREYIDRSIALGLHGTWQLKYDEHDEATWMGTIQIRLKTLADYMTINPGDLIFYFSQRRLILVGRVTAPRADETVVWENWTGSSGLRPPPEPLHVFAADLPSSSRIPWLVSFEPIQLNPPPSVDMDVVLEGDTGRRMRTLTTFSKLNVARLGPEETGLLLGALLREHDCEWAAWSFAPVARTCHRLLTDGAPASADELILAQFRRNPNAVAEGAVECWLIDKLRRHSPEIRGLFGQAGWRWLTTQKLASPNKPRSYADKIDIYAELVRQRGEGIPASVEKHLVIEVKAGAPTARGPNSVVGQVMKYVDWIAHNEAGGDYGRVSAAVVAPQFGPAFHAEAREKGRVYYRRPGRGTDSLLWEGLKLVRYELGEAGNLRMAIAEGVHDD